MGECRDVRIDDGAPRFSVAITVWKREELLPAALRSVLEQDRPADELLVLCDGRSPAAERIVDGHRSERAIRYFEMPRRRKCWGNPLRQRALEEAGGSHVVLLGHDCLLYRGYLAAHEEILADDPAALPVVPIDYWRSTTPDGVMPRHDDPGTLGEGEIDLLNVAYPRDDALELDCFGPEMHRTRCADYLSFDRIRRKRTPVLHPGPPQAAHF